MSERFDAWPHEPTKIIEEALREYVGDGEGVDEAVLAAHDREVKAAVLREVAGIGAVDAATYLYLHDQANRIESEARP